MEARRDSEDTFTNKSILEMHNIGLHTDTVETDSIVGAISIESFSEDVDNITRRDSFEKEVALKRQRSLYGRREAELDVLCDRIVRQEGGANEALLFVTENVGSEARVHLLVNNLLQRGADPSCVDTKLRSPLHFVVERAFKTVCSKLLEHGASPLARDYNEVTPLKIAFDSSLDDIGSLLIKFITKKRVRSLFTGSEGKCCEFSFHGLLQKKMQKTVLAVLDCMIETKGKGTHYKAYYQILEEDESGLAPTDPTFNSQSRSPLHVMAKSGDKDAIYHDVVRLLTRRKWKLYAKWRFQLNLFLYLITLFVLTFSAVTGTMATDPWKYNSALHIIRAITEVCSLLSAILTCLLELNQLRKQRLGYFQDHFNYIDALSCLLIMLVLPLRLARIREQWYVFAFGYIFWMIRIFKFAAIYRQTGAYAQILWRILIHDFFQFTVLFCVILLMFSVSFLLTLKGDGTNDLHVETSNFGNILFTGVRTLIEAAPVVEYTGEHGYRPMSTFIMVVFLFTCCVVLLSILIGQLSDTYQSVQQDARRGLELNRAWIISKVELNSIFLGKGYRVTQYVDSEVITDIRAALRQWDRETVSSSVKSCMCDLWNSLETHRLNMINMKSKLSKQEASLVKIQKRLDYLIGKSRKIRKVPTIHRTPAMKPK